MRLWRRPPRPLQRLANDLAGVALKRWIAAGMEAAFVYGHQDERPFVPLDWLRPGVKALPYLYEVTFFTGGEEAGENLLRKAVPPAT